MQVSNANQNNRYLEWETGSNNPLVSPIFDMEVRFSGDGVQSPSHLDNRDVLMLDMCQ